MERGIDPELKKLVRESVALVDDFAVSDFRRDYIGDGQVFVLIPDDNPNLAKVNMESAQKAIGKGENVVIINASKGDDPLRYTKFAAPSSEEAPTEDEVKERLNRARSRLIDNYIDSDFAKEYSIQDNDSLWVIVPDDDPDLAGFIAQDAERVRLPGQDIREITASRDESGEYTRFVIIQGPSPEDNSS